MRVAEIVDLSLVLDSDTQVYPGDPQPHLGVATTIAIEGYNLLALQLGSQSGTHVDSPYHFLEAGPVLEGCPLSLFIGPGLVIDVTGHEPRTPIEWPEVEPYASRMESGTVVAFRTGWSDAHYGTDQYFEHPYLSADACERLLSLGVRTFLTDCINLDETVLDPEVTPSFPCHDLIAAAAGIISENITNLGAVDFDEPLFSLMPIRLGGNADGAPCRAVALKLEPQRR